MEVFSGRTPASEGFCDVFFIDASTGWIVGSSIYKTTDGGSSWTKHYGDSSSELDAISFFDPLNGWATGFNILVLHTTDGGQTWVPQNVGAPPVTAFTGVTAVNSTTAWVAGWNGFVAQTRNGGQTWKKETIAGAEGIDFEDALFLDAQSGRVGWTIGIWNVLASLAPISVACRLLTRSRARPLDSTTPAHHRRRPNLGCAKRRCHQSTASHRCEFRHGQDRRLKLFVARAINRSTSWRAETIAGAKTTDFEDALFLDAKRG
jgi:hypothetical protein